MKNSTPSRIASILIALLVVGSHSPQIVASREATSGLHHQSQAAEYVPGEIIVELRQSDGAALWSELSIPSKNVERLDRYVSIETLAYRKLSLERRGESSAREMPRSQFLIRVAEGDEPETLEQLLANEHVLSAERAVYWHVHDTPTSEPLWNGVWAGVFFGQWGPKKIEAPRAWDKTHGRSSTGEKPAVAVIDTAFEDHDDLRSNVDPRSRNFTTGGNPTHLMAVAGVIGAAWNSIGMAGECPDANMMLLGVGTRGPDGKDLIDSAKVIEATNYFIAQNPKGGVINMSLGAVATSQALLDIIQASPILVVASVGNESAGQPDSPAYLSQYTRKVLAVAASDVDDSFVSTSNRGGDLCAPGNGLVTTAPGNTWGGISLTSAAAASVSGVAALIWFLEDGDPVRVANRLLATVDTKSDYQGKVKSSGRLNAARAAWNERNPAPVLTASFDRSLYQAAETQPVTFSLLVSNPDARVTWSFGDGTVASGSFIASHSYQSFGQYTVSASVTDGVAQVSPAASVMVTDLVSLKVKLKAGGGKVVVTATSSRQGQSSSPTLTILETGTVLPYDPDLQAYRLKLKTKDLPATLNVRSSLGGEASQAWR